MRIPFSTTLALFLLAGSLWAQNPARPNAIQAKRIFTDHISLAEGQKVSLSNWAGGFELAYLRNVNRYLNFVIPVKYALMRLPGEEDNQRFFGLDGVVQLQAFKEGRTVVPYFLAGVGGVLDNDDQLDLQVPVGVGVNIHFHRFGYINLQTAYRASTDLGRPNWQSGIGIGVMLGKGSDDAPMPLASGSTTNASNANQPMLAKDTDKDGVPDHLDKCPNVPGLANTKGCPDTDGDGVGDADDLCPDTAGPRIMSGCPDADGDGVSDRDDKCPDAVGTAEFNGCPPPDSDNDGIPDNQDKCPSLAGPVNGCPDTDGDGVADQDDRCAYHAGPASAKGCPDTDNDGLVDPDDKCPNQAGAKENGGCPELKPEDKAILDFALRAVQFDAGKDKLRNESKPILDQVFDVVQKYPDFHLTIIGHTDDKGDEERNLDLSQRRAKACYAYLLEKGLKQEKMSYGGFGETRPIAKNTTEEGRKLNRRVEFELKVD